MPRVYTDLAFAPMEFDGCATLGFPDHEIATHGRPHVDRSDCEQMSQHLTGEDLGQGEAAIKSNLQ